MRVILSLKGNLAMSADIFNCHTWEGEPASSEWRPGVSLNFLQCTAWPLQKMSGWTSLTSCAEIETPYPRPLPMGRCSSVILWALARWGMRCGRKKVKLVMWLWGSDSASLSPGLSIQKIDIWLLVYSHLWLWASPLPFSHKIPMRTQWKENTD